MGTFRYKCQQESTRKYRHKGVEWDEVMWQPRDETAVLSIRISDSCASSSAEEKETKTKRKLTHIFMRMVGISIGYERLTFHRLSKKSEVSGEP